MYILVLTELCARKMEIMHIEQGKLCVKNVLLCTILCANINKKDPSPCFSFTFLLKKVKTKKKVLTN